jgi:concentrative nucleoside transporter, CNT family
MKITNGHLKSETKLIGGLLKFIFFFLSFFIFSNSASAFEDTHYYRKSFKLILKKEGRFFNNDTTFSSIKHGKYSVKNDSIFLTAAYSKDSFPKTEALKIVFQSSNKLSFQKGSKKISFHDKESSIHQSGASIQSVGRGILGMAFLLLLAFLFSKNRKRINWSLVAKGILLQVILALLILKVPFISSIFDFLANAFRTVIDFAHEGATFVFGQGDFMPDTLKNFAFWILPSVIFFSAISSLLYYWGILQLIVKGMAWVMKRILGISGSESVAAAANIFIGQTEAPLLVKPYLPRMTKSEIMCLMVGGMATIAGGVLAAVIKILGDGDAVKELFYAKHLLTASIMSAPAAIVFAKMLLPETEPIDNNLDVSKEKLGANALEAITNGTTDGMKLAVNVGAMLIVFISLIALFNYMLGKAGEITHLNDLIAQGGIYKTLSFESISGYFFAPIAWLMGVEWQDSILVGQLLGEKTILNEFIAYPHLGLIQDELSQKSIIMCTYVLCGFANFASIGIQVGGIGILVPEKKGILAKYGFLALVGGTLACMSTAVVAGMLF